MMMHAVEDYLALRRAAGFKMTIAARLLGNFACFAARRRDQRVRSTTAIEWASRAPSPVQRSVRLLTVVRFARHARLDDERHEVPSPDALPRMRYQQTCPYLFSPDEIQRLLELAATLRPRGSIRPHALRMVFGLLAATGMRVSEALALRFDDVTPDGLVVRKTKFQKSRLLPLHPTVVRELGRYLARRRRLPGAHLFISQLGKPLRYDQVNWAFGKLAKRMGISRTGPARPRIHTLRHTFAVRALERCPNGLDHVARHMLALMTYLGHARVSSTYWYLQATPHLLADIGRAFEAFFAEGAT